MSDRITVTCPFCNKPGVEIQQPDSDIPHLTMHNINHPIDGAGKPFGRSRWLVRCPASLTPVERLY